MGNRPRLDDTGVASNRQPEKSTYDGNDRLTTMDFGDRLSTDFTYDAAGHLVRKFGDFDDVTYSWDLAGRLVQATVLGASTSYGYNPGGIRVSQGVPNQSPTKSLIDEAAAYDQVLEEYAPGGALAASYIRGHDLLFQDRGGTKSYAVKDGLGSIRAVTNASATVTDTLTYDAFGRDLGRTGTTILAFQYAGEQLDANTRQYYLRARYYDTAAGRFTARDPYKGRISEPITQNHYIYAGADPVDYSDPSGYSFGFSVGGLLGASLRIATWGAVAVTAAYVAWSYLGPSSYARWGQKTPWMASWYGPAAIREFDRAAIEAARTYKDADLGRIFSHYARIYPSVTSRRCHEALDDLMAQLKRAVSAEPAIRSGMTFISGLIVTTGVEPDNILILMPNQYANQRDVQQLSNPGWYDSEAKKNIIFFYAGSVPIQPVGNLYDAVVHSSGTLWGEFVRLEVYYGPDNPGESF